MGEWMDEITLRMKDFLGLYIPSNDQINEPAINQIQSASPTTTHGGRSANQIIKGTTNHLGLGVLFNNHPAGAEGDAPVPFTRGLRYCDIAIGLR